MNEFQFVTDTIEVRSTVGQDGITPEYCVSGYAVVPNMWDIYKYQKDSDGSVRSFKSMFTENCIQSIKKQAKMKKLFVDSSHELAGNLFDRNQVFEREARWRSGRLGLN